MVEAFIEIVLSFSLVWFGGLVVYRLYNWYNSSRRVIRRKLIEARYWQQSVGVP